MISESQNNIDLGNEVFFYISVVCPLFYIKGSIHNTLIFKRREMFLFFCIFRESLYSLKQLIDASSFQVGRLKDARSYTHSKILL